MALGIEFITLQFVISLFGYIIHQHTDFPIQKILGIATLISILSPLLMIDYKTVDTPLATTIIQNYIQIIPEQIIGLIIGSVVTGGIHGLKSILEYFGIEIR